MSTIIKKQIKSVVIILISLILLISASLSVTGPVSHSSMQALHWVPLLTVSGPAVSATSGQSVTIGGEQVPLTKTPKKKTVKIKKLRRIRYAKKTIKIHKEVSLKSKTIKKIPKDAKFKVVGKVVGKKKYKVKYKGKTGFIKMSKKILTSKKPFVWKGPKLTKRKGVNQGPSGKETYYNMSMGGVISIMRHMGIKCKYWVRGDGCKMLGKYIIVAANLRVHPRGSIVKTSLGLGRVCDTGGFAAHNSHQLDIAVAW